MALFDNLFGYRRVRRYDSVKTRKDSRLHTGYDYENLPPSEFIGRALSGHIQRNEIIRYFLMFLDDNLKTLLRSALIPNKISFSSSPERTNMRLSVNWAITAGIEGRKALLIWISCITFPSWANNTVPFSVEALDPTNDELARIINNLIDEEILYREALLLGLDQEDTIIKRRLAQKISFLKEESIPKIPSVNELKEYYENNKEKYFIESSFTFTHYYFSENNNSFDRSQQAIKALQENSTVKSDPFYLGKAFANEPLRNIETNFGKAFSKELMEANLNQWTGPFESTYGHHIVHLNSTNPGYIPEI